MGTGCRPHLSLPSQSVSFLVPYLPPSPASPIPAQKNNSGIHRFTFASLFSVFPLQSLFLTRFGHGCACSCITSHRVNELAMIVRVGCTWPSRGAGGEARQRGGRRRQIHCGTRRVCQQGGGRTGTNAVQTPSATAIVQEGDWRTVGRCGFCFSEGGGFGAWIGDWKGGVGGGRSVRREPSVGAKNSGFLSGGSCKFRAFSPAQRNRNPTPPKALDPSLT